MSIGQNIKKVRKERGLTQGKLAEDAHISRTYLADLEGDRYNPSIDTLKAIATALSIDLYVLIKDQSIVSFVNRSIVKSFIENQDDEAPTELTPMEAAIAYFRAEKGRDPTDEELALFRAFTKPVLDSLPDKAD